MKKKNKKKKKKKQELKINLREYETSVILRSIFQ